MKNTSVWVIVLILASLNNAIHSKEVSNQAAGRSYRNIRPRYAKVLLLDLDMNNRCDRIDLKDTLSNQVAQIKIGRYLDSLFYVIPERKSEMDSCLKSHTGAGPDELNEVLSAFCEQYEKKTIYASNRIICDGTVSCDTLEPRTIEFDSLYHFLKSFESELDRRVEKDLNGSNRKTRTSGESKASRPPGNAKEYLRQLSWPMSLFLNK